jgi:transcriptional regulator with XRE-family HTH domain
MSAKNLGKKIKLARKEFGLTQSDLAFRMGISPQLISAFEAGRIPPDPSYITQIAQFTHKPLHFFTGQKIAAVLDKVEKMIIELQEIKKTLEQITEAE